MISIKTTGFDEVTKEVNDAIKSMPVTIKEVLEDVLVNDMLRDAKINAKGKELGRGGSGHLARNIFHKVWEQRNKILGALLVDLKQVPYARIHEKGGTITPRKAQHLTIPFPGVKGFARDFQNTFTQKSKAGNLIIFQNMGAGKIRPLFTLKKRVTIPQRQYLEPAILKHKPKLEKELQKVLNKEK